MEIADDEKIEISIIDDQRELMQFVGSTGQCLIAFSNAKKCATFLQDNRLLIAKTHSKVILLTPKEIPAKTLSRFTKIGLTESILENSPPKTLLYKVKLLLRSIKSTGSSEEKELAVRSIDAVTTNEAQAKSELKIDRPQNEDVAVNYLNEERAKYKKNDTDLDSVNPVDHLKRKTAVQEETIETHWKSKRKNDENLSAEDEDDFSKIESEGPREIDMYYRGKKKDNYQDVIESDEISKRKRQEQIEEEEGASLLPQESLKFNLAPGEAEKRKKFIEEEQARLQLKESKDSLKEEETKDEQPYFVQNEEDAQEQKRKDLMELEALFEEAKKRQSEEAAHDLGGHYKGKITNTNLDLEEAEEEEREEYDNSDLYSRKKSMNLDLVPGKEDAYTNKQGEPEDEEDKEEERIGYGEKIGGLLESEEGQTDHIETIMKCDIGLDRSKNIKTYDIQERQKPKSEDEAAPEKSGLLDLGEKTAETGKTREKKEKNEVKEKESKQSLNLGLSPALSEQNPKEPLDDEEDQSSRAKATKLKILDGDGDSNHGKSDVNEDEDIAFRKLDKQADPEDKKKETDFGKKIDKIDGYMRGGEARKKDQDWNLHERKSNFDLGLEKKKREEDGTQKKEVVDLGEQTIDYRKIKEEFDAISRGEEIGGVSASEEVTGRIKEGSEDDSFKVVEVETAGLDFAVEILNMINLKEIRPEDLYRSISEELKNSYHAWPIFYSFNPSEKKHTEIFDSILKLATEDNLRIWWMDHKKDESIWSNIQSKSMTTWICRELKWEDVELPTWASNELMKKKVELIYPYYDGVDRMGLAVVYFPDGINPKQVRGIEVTLEMARTLLLETIQRKTIKGALHDGKDESIQDESSTQKKKFISVFSGLFGKNKKAG